MHPFGILGKPYLGDLRSPIREIQGRDTRLQISRIACMTILYSVVQESQVHPSETLLHLLVTFHVGTSVTVSAGLESSFDLI